MPRPPETRIVLLTRVTDHGPRKHITSYFTFPGGLKSRRCRVTFVRREHVPAFEGAAAWFEIEKVPAKPWSYWRAVRQVEAPEGR